MDKILNTLGEYLKAAGGLVKTYGPQVWDATLSLVQLNAIVYLLIWGVVLAATIIGWRVFGTAVLGIAKTVWQEDKDKHSYDRRQWPYALATITGLILVALTIAAVGHLAMIYYWIAAFRPDLAVLYSLAQKVGLL